MMDQMKIFNTQKNNNTKFKTDNFKLSSPLLNPDSDIDLRTLGSNTIIDLLEANIQKREKLFAHTELSKKLNK